MYDLVPAIQSCDLASYDLRVSETQNDLIPDIGSLTDSQLDGSGEDSFPFVWTGNI